MLENRPFRSQWETSSTPGDQAGERGTTWFRKGRDTENKDPNFVPLEKITIRANTIICQALCYFFQLY